MGPLGRLTSRFGKKRRQRAKERAGRAYYRQYEAGKPSDASQAGPRAAVYKGEMGASHRRSSRMQQKEAGASRRVKMPEAKPPFFTRAPFIVTCATVRRLGLGAAFLYGPAQQLYTDIRERDRLAAEYEAVTERNAAIEASVDALSHRGRHRGRGPHAARLGARGRACRVRRADWPKRTRPPSSVAISYPRTSPPRIPGTPDPLDPIFGVE